MLVKRRFQFRILDRRKKRSKALKKLRAEGRPFITSTTIYENINLSMRLQHVFEYLWMVVCMLNVHM